MTVFRGYLLIIKRNWGFIFIYNSIVSFDNADHYRGKHRKRKKKNFKEAV